MKVELSFAGDLWPRCFLDKERRCGEPGAEDRRGWHVAAMCDCPSCPVRCAISTALYEYKKAA